MKVAICGAGPLGVELSLALNELGAGVTIFVGPRGVGGTPKLLAREVPELRMPSNWSMVTSHIGRGICVSLGDKNFLDNEFLKKHPTMQEYWENYLSKLVSSAPFNTLTQKGPVARVQKRFLDLAEKPAERSRLHDLFRVVYKVDPSLDIRSQIEEGGLKLEGVSPELVKSLQGQMESFEDFDLVVDATGVHHAPLFMGPGGSPALNEKALLEKGHIFYGLEALDKPQDWQNSKHLLLVGSGALSALLLVKLNDWLWSKDNHRVTLVTTEENPFEKLRHQLKGSDLLKGLDMALDANSEKWEKDKEEFHCEMTKWKELEDYMKAKVRPPAEPVQKIRMLTGANVVAADRLLDREGTFITVEGAPFRRSTVELETLAVDAVLVASGHKKRWDVFEGLQLDREWRAQSQESLHPEPGFYSLGGADLAHGLSKIPKIVENMLSFFSRVE